MKEYDAYLFDWDGTVAETLGVWLSIVRATVDSYHIEATDKELVRKVFGRVRDGLKELGIPEKDFDAIFSEWDKKAQKQLPLAPFYPGITDLFALLKSRGKKLAVVTATIRPNLQKVLDHHNLHAMFDVVVAGDEIRAHKPDPEGVLVALNKLGVPKDRAVMLGDSEKDIRAANNAGIDSVLFFPPEHEILHTLTELQADNPTYTIGSWDQVFNQLQKETA